MKHSNCCDAPVVEETDVCSKCNEHCSTVEYREDEGDLTGFTLVHEYWRWLNDLSDTYPTYVYVNFKTQDVLIVGQEDTTEAGQPAAGGKVLNQKLKLEEDRDGKEKTVGFFRRVIRR